MSAQRPHHVRRSSTEMDKMRSEASVATIKARALDTYEWIAKLLKWSIITDKTPDEQVEAFFHNIESGVALCELLNIIDSQYSVKYKPEAKSGSFQARDNVEKFLQSAAKFGVPSVALFEVEDLVSRKSDKTVVNTLLYIAKLAAQKYNIQPPSIIQYELEIESLIKERNERKNKGESVDEEEFEQEIFKRTRTGSISGPIDGINFAELASPPPRVDVDTIAEATEQMGVVSLDSPKPVSIQQLQAKAEQAESSAPVIVNLDETPTPEVKNPESSSVKPPGTDELDSAVGKMMQKSRIKLSIVKLQVKNKKRARDSRKGEYKVQGEKIFVRQVQGVLLAHVQGKWIDFLTFCKQKEDEIAAKASGIIA